MKTNPTCAKAECPKEFPDNLNFCQLCGARLTAVVAVDPFKTVVASSSANRADDIIFIPEPPPIESPELPAEVDSMKTMVVSDFVIPEAINIQSESLPLPPIFEEPIISPPDFGNLPSATTDPETEATLISAEVPNFDATFTGIPLPGNSRYRTPTDEPVSSPFEQPASNPFDLPSPPAFEPTPYQEPQSLPQNDPFGSSPFSPPPSPFGQQNQMQQAWTPPPAPDANWSNQGVGQNTPFQPPPISSGQNQTLAIVSLVCGVLAVLLSICCYGGLPLGIAAIITGFLGIKNVNSNPVENGGKGIAIGGIITGVIGFLISLGLLIFVIILQVAK